ncbi:MAG: trypsin-like peptidase domain-containing protein [Rubrivivax sp.]|nr:trypsin-like peptidase domain-containing protein [Rubrivivax sp.]
MWRRAWLVFSQAVTVAVAVLFVVATLKPDWLPGARRGSLLPTPTVYQVAPSPAGAASAAGFALAAQRAAPAVVSITATRMARRHPLADDPRFRFFFPEGAVQQRQVGLGSGVIVSPEGYLLTNHHVIENAIDIEVQLTDGRATRASVVGSDPETDIAVLRIELDRLPAITLGDVASLQVGDAVLAIGNPFNVGQTVTAGIVSALDRNQAGASRFQNFIQTDAAINPGNSGGALVDAQGHLVGINTAIFSRTGGSLGIGFAVPVDTARQVMEQLVAGGAVRRGWIGVEPRDLSAELAETLALPVSQGALITGVLASGPAAAAGLRPGDVVLRVGERPVASAGDLLAAVTAQPPGSEVGVQVQRGRQVLDLPVKVGERPRAAAAQR